MKEEYDSMALEEKVTGVWVGKLAGKWIKTSLLKP